MQYDYKYIISDLYAYFSFISINPKCSNIFKEPVIRCI